MSLSVVCGGGTLAATARLTLMARNPPDTPAPGAQNGQRSRPIDELRNQLPTVAVCTLVAVLIVVLAVLDEVHTADAIALEGVVVAVLFGVVALAAATEHKNSLVEVAADIETVVGTASQHEQSLGAVAADITTVTSGLNAMSKTVLTRPIPFDDQLVRITQLIRAAGAARTGAAPGRDAPDLRVLCDNPAFGIFSEGANFDAYLAALKSQVAGCVSVPPTRRVELMFLGAKERRELHLDQVKRYSTEESWQEWRDNQHKKLAEFWQRTARICDCDEKDAVLPQALELDDYVKRLELVNADVRKRHLAGARIHDLAFPSRVGGTLARQHGPTVYFWMRDEGIRDEQEAIFAIVPLGEVEAKAREHAFYTRDPDLILALVGVFERYRQPALATRR